jgi:hypothetical protein
VSTRVNSVLSTGLAKVEKEVVNEVVNDIEGDVDEYEEKDFVFIHQFIYIFKYLFICSLLNQFH